MDFLKKRIINLTDEELEQCYDDILEYRKKGKMKNTSLIRKIRNENAKHINIPNWDSDCRVVTIPEILLEIAKRYYKQRG